MTTREIDERIAAALEQVAGRAYVVRIEVALQNTAKNLREEAAELRAAEPAPRKPLSVSEAMSRVGTSPSSWPEQVSHEVPVSEPVVAIGTNATGTNTPKSRDAGSIRATYTGVVSGDSGPVSRDTNGAASPPSLVERFKKWHVGMHDDCLHCDVADALEAAQAEAISYRVNFAPYVDRAQKSLTAPSSLGQSVLKAALDELDEARADTRRLDWLEAHGTWQFHGPREVGDEHEDRWFDNMTDGSDYSPTLRVAIDRALAAAMERKPK